MAQTQMRSRLPVVERGRWPFGGHQPGLSPRERRLVPQGVLLSGWRFAFGLFAAGGASAVDVQGRRTATSSKFAEIASLLAQFATANVSTTACEGSILERLRP